MAVPTIYARLIAAWEAAAPSRAAGDVARACRAAAADGVRLRGAAGARRSSAGGEISGHTLLERYGMTEIGMALSNPLHGERRPGFVGAPLPGVEVRLVDEHGGAVAAGHAGRDRGARAPTSSCEYWRRPEATARRLPRTAGSAPATSPSWSAAATGSSAAASVDIIKTGGYKVSALEIEEVLRAHPAIGECAVVGVRMKPMGRAGRGGRGAQDGAALELEELRAWGKERLAPYKVPRVCCAGESCRATRWAR